MLASFLRRVLLRSQRYRQYILSVGASPVVRVPVGGETIVELKLAPAPKTWPAVALDPLNSFLHPDQCFAFNKQTGQRTAMSPMYYATPEAADLIALATGASVTSYPASSNNPDPVFVRTSMRMLNYANNISVSAGFVAYCIFMQMGYFIMTGIGDGLPLTFKKF